MLDAEGGTEHVDLEHLADVARLELDDQAGDLHPGVVDQDVQAAELADRHADGALTAGVVGDVQRDEHRGGTGSAELIGGRLAEVLPDVADGNGRSSTGERLRHACAESARAAGDQSL